MAIRITIVILIVAASGLFASRLRSEDRTVEVMPRLADIPAEVGGWWSEESQLTDVEARVLAADATVTRLYRNADGTRVWFFIAYFAQQQVNSQIHSPRNCIPGAGWRVESVKTLQLPIDGEARTTSCMTIASDRAKESVYYWFRTRGGRIAGEYALKFDLIRNALGGRPTDAAFVRVVSSDDDAARELMALLQKPIDDVLGDVGL